MGSQRAGYDLMTKQQQTNFSMYILCKIKEYFKYYLGDIFIETFFSRTERYCLENSCLLKASCSFSFKINACSIVPPWFVT